VTAVATESCISEYENKHVVSKIKNSKTCCYVFAKFQGFLMHALSIKCEFRQAGRIQPVGKVTKRISETIMPSKGRRTPAVRPMTADVRLPLCGVLDNSDTFNCCIL
jgi:hypothetical protein